MLFFHKIGYLHYNRTSFHMITSAFRILFLVFIFCYTFIHSLSFGLAFSHFTFESFSCVHLLCPVSIFISSLSSAGDCLGCFIFSTDNWRFRPRFAPQECLHRRIGGSCTIARDSFEMKLLSILAHICTRLTLKSAVLVALVTPFSYSYAASSSMSACFGHHPMLQSLLPLRVRDSHSHTGHSNSATSTFRHLRLSLPLLESGSGPIFDPGRVCVCVLIRWVVCAIWLSFTFDLRSNSIAFNRRDLLIPLAFLLASHTLESN